MNKLRQVVEAMIFAAEDPLTIDRLATLLEQPRARIRECLLDVQQHHVQQECGFQLVEIGNGYQFRTLPELAPYLRKLGRERAPKFSRAAMETLSIIAYRQPVTRAEIEYLRGVDSGGVMKTLLDRNLLRILGKKDVPGRPLMYGTSRHFLELFGLRSLNDLPTLKEFSALDDDIAEAEPLAAGKSDSTT